MLTDKDLDVLLKGTGVQRFPREHLLEQTRKFFTDPSIPGLLLVIGLVKMIGLALCIYFYCITNP
ncbi:MAG: hypothetical protein OHK0057_07110 [Thermoflexibacter sp.]